MPKLGSWWMVLASLGLGLMTYFVKLLSDRGLDYQEIVFGRMLVATIILFLVIKTTGKSIKTTHLKGHMVRGVVGTTALILYFYLIAHVSLVTAATLNYTSAIWNIIFSFFILKNKASISVVLCVIMGFVGVIVLLEPTFAQGEIGNILVGVLTGATAALAYIQVKILTLAQEPEWKIVFYFSFIGVVITGIWSVITGVHVLNLTSLCLILVMGLSALFGQICMTLAYAQGSFFVSSILSYLTIVVSFLIDCLMLGNQLTAKEALGVFLVIISGVMSSWFNRSPLHH